MNRKPSPRISVMSALHRASRCLLPAARCLLTNSLLLYKTFSFVVQEISIEKESIPLSAVPFS
jgi:hypothetical protein